MTNLSVFSEIGRLRAVGVHCPGNEVDVMTPTLMHQLLFDDILFGSEARQEHDIFADVLARVADVHDVKNLLASALNQPQATAHFLDRFCALHKLNEAQREFLADQDSDILAGYAIEGWLDETNAGKDYDFHFPPVPNLLFMRDPAAVIGHNVSINNMATSARQPEPFILETIMRFHPEFKVDDEANILFNAVPSYLAGNPMSYHTIEGGDMLVMSEDVLAIGISIRTTQSAVTLLAERLRRQGEFKTILAVLMPQERAVMHLDTIFTQIDEENCLIFPPFFHHGHQGTLPVIRMDLTGKEVSITIKDSFLKSLADEGIPLRPILCGGDNRLHQEREQWTDGANAFCLAPGVILGYSRNLHTAAELSKAGYNIVTAEEVIERDIDLLDGKRYMVLIRGNELSRARGGARCMTFPLRRDPLR